MTSMTPSQATSTSPTTARDHFLDAVLAKLTEPVHRELLEACRGSDPATAMDAVLAKAVLTICDEDTNA